MPIPTYIDIITDVFWDIVIDILIQIDLNFQSTSLSMPLSKSNIDTNNITADAFR